MSRKIIPVPGEGVQFIFVEDSGGSLVQIKSSVATFNDLPISGNVENDLRITQDTDRMYTWSIAATSGPRSNWSDIGQSISLDWSAITGGPTASPNDIDQAVTDMHTHANKALLDTYNQANADISDAVAKKHAQNTDTALDSGGANPITAAEAKEAFDKKHTQDTDQKLDDGGVNEVIVADVKDAVDKKHTRSHAIDSSGDHTSTIPENNLMDADSNGLPDNSNLSVSDVADAVTKKHNQNSDTALDSGGANPITASEAKQAFDAIGNVGTKEVDEAQIGDDKVVTFDLASGKEVYKDRINIQGGITYFLHEELSDVATYQKMLDSPADDAENADSAIANSGTGEVLIKAFVTEPGVPNTLLLSDGVWSFQTYAGVSADAGVSTIVIRVYKRTTGGVETELFSSTTGEINGSSATLYSKDSVQPDFSIDTTDRIVIKFFAQSTSGSNKTITLFYEGTANYTHVHTPLVISADGHTQNTDTGTNSPTFALDTEASGFDPVKIKNESGEMGARNNADNGYVNFNVKNIKGVDAEFTGEIGDANNKADANTILTSSLEFVIDGGGAEIGTGIAGDLQAPFDCDILEVVLLADQAGLIKVDIWKDTYANFPPTDADTITGGNEPEISTSGGDVKYKDNTLTSWTTSISVGDILRFNTDSVTTIERCTVVLKVRKT